jgi:GTP-binding protein EngB required for normal cell division
MVRTYADARDRLRAALSELSVIVGPRARPEALASVGSLERQLEENRFNVVVFGAFKRGKTTFVNALLGADVLPTAVVPLTSIATAIGWGREVRVRIEYLDGRAEDVDVSALARFVTETGNPGNRLGVARAVVTFPSRDLEDGVSLLDTPGVGSVYEHNTDAARASLADADAAIFLTSADPPISDSERAFLADVREHASRLFFVLNKVDYLSASDREEALAFTQEVVSAAVGRRSDVFAMSARSALTAKLLGDEAALAESGFTAFQRHFRRFLLDEKGQAIVESVARRALRLADDERNVLGIEERAAELSAEEVREARARMETVFAEARARQQEMQALLQHAARRLVDVLDEDLARLRAAEGPRLLRLARERMSRVEDVRVAGAEIDALVKETLRADVERWRPEEEKRLGAELVASSTRSVDEAGRIERETVLLCGEILGIELLAEGNGVDLSPHTRFTYSFFEVPTILESILPDVRRLLPRRSALRLLERDMAERIPRWVDKHSGRLRWDFVQRIDQTLRELGLALDRRLEATIERLTEGLERSKGDQARSEENAREVGERASSLRRRLDDLRRTFLAASDDGDLEVAR